MLLVSFAYLKESSHSLLLGRESVRAADFLWTPNLCMQSSAKGISRVVLEFLDSQALLSYKELFWAQFSVLMVVRAKLSS